MKSWKFKILFPLVLITLLVITKFILFDVATSTGKRTGNLAKISERGRLIKTWEGTLDLGSGDKLTFDFSVRDENVAKELYDFEGREITIFYEEFLKGWPRETKYSVRAWKARSGQKNDQQSDDKNITTSSNGAYENQTSSLLSKTLFCSLLGSIYQDEKLYKNVKEHLKDNNLYLFNQIEKCND